MNNILFVMSDQFRADALGLMNRFPVKTPILDRHYYFQGKVRPFFT